MEIFTEQYRPRKVSDFIGLSKPKEKMLQLIARPRSSAWLFIGPSGMGKTTLALAVAEEMNAELHHIPSQKCTVDAIESIRRKCANYERECAERAAKSETETRLHLAS